MSTSRGRPRDSSLDGAIAAATESVLLADGYPAVSIDRVAKLAGTTRTAVYRRVSNRGELVVGLLVHRFGSTPARDTGDLGRDLRAVQVLQAAFFSDPVIEAGIAGVLSDIRSNPELGAVFYERFMEPRRRSVAELLERATARGEIGPVEVPARISDLLTGPLLLRAVMPVIGPIDDELIDLTVRAALAVIPRGS
ncbi:TetR/AcrR family transcriptional regulator [Pseudonocardia spinosispora]|uniref:TetR/AcrR family transcriptional regulator n=1 Tax=Pseudonocardia spinosispora TaxID=103441 RepID=UPI001B7FDC8F|nr:TetR/AcrR family transcriptional regulator [Pseudonocardia spinosispora]